MPPTGVTTFDAHGDPMTNEIFIGRQPILDSDRQTFGYELLYRNGPDTAMLSESPDDATRAVMERALLQWGMEKIIGNRFGLINASPTLIVSGLHRAMPPEGIIFEICETTPFDGPTYDALVRARYDGYHFALDNVTRLADLVDSRLLPHASIVKIELRNALEIEIPQLIAVARERAPGVLVAAEKVETAADFARCLDYGFDLFQGYFFAEPEVLKRPARPANVASAMALLAEMQRNDIDIDRTEELVGSDPSLTFRLLAIANSSAFGLNRRVDSLRHTIILLGLGQVRRLAALIALSTAAGASEELIALGATRARMIGSLMSEGAASSVGFTVGLLSVTDAIYHTPMDELVGELPVSTEIGDALVDGEGELGRALDIVRACEAGDVDRLDELGAGSLDHLRHMYAEAIEWADDLRAQIVGPKYHTPQLV
jgi:EAL and modified HD-GYP domain-containing signal transduction protein